MDMGYGDDLWFDLADGREAHICCAVLRWLEGQGQIA
jgi:hypothetical protein